MISLDGVAGELYLQGAHLTAWQPPAERPVLFTSPNDRAPIRVVTGAGDASEAALRTVELPLAPGCECLLWGRKSPSKCKR